MKLIVKVFVKKIHSQKSKLIFFVLMFSFGNFLNLYGKQDSRTLNKPQAYQIEISQNSEKEILVPYSEIMRKNNLIRLGFRNEIQRNRIDLSISYDPSIIKLDYMYAPLAFKGESLNQEHIKVQQWSFKNRIKIDYKIIASQFFETEIRVRFSPEDSTDDFVEKIIKIIGQKPRIIPASNLKISNNSLDFDELTFTDSESLSEKRTNVNKWQGCDSLPDGENLWLDISFDDTTGMLKCGKVLVNNKPFDYNKNEKNIIIGLGREKKEISVETFITRPKIINEGAFRAQAIIALKSDNPTIQFEGNESRQELEPVKYTWRIKRDEGVVFGTLMIFIIGIVVILGLVAFGYIMKSRNPENRRKRIQNPSDEDEDYYEPQRAHDGYSNKEFVTDSGKSEQKKGHERTQTQNESHKPYLKITPNPVEFVVPAFSEDVATSGWWVYGNSLQVDLNVSPKTILRVICHDTKVLISRDKSGHGNPKKCTGIEFKKGYSGGLTLHVYVNPVHINDEHEGIIVVNLNKPGNWRKRHEEIDMQEIRYRCKTVEEDSMKHQSSHEEEFGSRKSQLEKDDILDSSKQYEKQDDTEHWLNHLKEGRLAGKDIWKWKTDSIKLENILKNNNNVYNNQKDKNSDNAVNEAEKDLRQENEILKKQLSDTQELLSKERLRKTIHDNADSEKNEHKITEKKDDSKSNKSAKQRDEIRRLESLNRNQKKNIDKLENELKKYEAELKEINKKNRTFEKEQVEKTEQLAKTNDEIEKYRAEIDSLTSKLEQVDDEKANLQESLKKQHDEIATLESQLDKANALPDLLKLEASHKQQEIEGMVRQLEQIFVLLQKPLDIREIQQEAGESIRKTRERLLEIITLYLTPNQKDYNDAKEQLLDDIKTVKTSRLEVILKYLKGKDVGEIKKYIVSIENILKYF